MSEEKAHSKFSASGSERWLNCPGSVALSEKAPPQIENKYALEGTRAHECLELVLRHAIATRNGEMPRPLSWNGFDDEMIHHAMESTKYILRRLPKGAVLLCETKVSLEFIASGMFGTVDAAIVDEFGRLWVFDFKYGAGHAVNPENNSQMIYYALGIAHKYNYNFADVCLSIIQPRAEHERGPNREWVIEIDELRSWSEKFLQGVSAAKKSNAPLVDGDWCRWCPAKVICPQLSDQAFVEAQISFDVQAEELPGLPVPNMISPDTLSRTLPAIDKIETWIEAVKAHTLHVLERGVKVPGYKLVAKRSTRKWTDPHQVEAVWGAKAFDEPEIMSPAKFEKKYGKSGEAFVAKNTTSISSGVTVAAEKDSRPEVNRVNDDFTEVIDTEKVTAKTKPPTKTISKRRITNGRENGHQQKKGTNARVSRKLSARI